MTERMKTRLPVTGMIGSSLFFSGVTFAATLPYGAVVGIEVLHFSNSMYAGLLMVSSLIGRQRRWGWAIFRTRFPTADCW